MIFLPVVERELRVAARKRSTFWVRIIAALVALVIGSGCLGIATVGPPGFGAFALGRGLFAALTWLGLAAALSVGLFFTSDCLSEEKREGTLGFLFLTDLHGYDIVLGKLLATSLRGFYALLAVFPILAVTLLLGGVTGVQFWKTSLALINALLISLAAGLFVSAISRDSQKALAATLFLLLLLAAGGPAGDAIFAAITQRGFNSILSLSSPVYLFVTAGAWGRTPFWLGFLLNQVIAWMLLALTCALLPRTWQERASENSSLRRTWAHWWKFGGAKRRAMLRRKLMDVNPVSWLVCRERWQADSLWVLAILLAGGFVVMFASTDQWEPWIVWSYFGNALTFGLYLGIASQAGRFFVEAQRNGLSELLLATPLTVHQIVRGCWRAVLRMFGPPVALCLVVQLLGAALAQNALARMAAAIPTPPAPPMTSATTTNSVTTTTNMTMVTPSTRITVVTGSIGGFTLTNVLVALASSIVGTLTVAANLVALCWFGMWMGLTSRNTNLATLKAIVFVQIIPWFVVSFASWIIVMLVLLPRLIKGATPGPALMMVWFPLLTLGLATVLYLTKDIAFLVWARRRLYSEFRERAARVVGPIQSALPPPLPEQARRL